MFRQLTFSPHTNLGAFVDLPKLRTKKYLLRIFDKVGTSSRVELVLYAMSHGAKRPAEWMPGTA